MEKLKPPFPWFGGKSRAAPVIWERLGNVPSYIEPFAGSLATILLRPHPPAIKEIVNDADIHIANFWRAMQADPAGLAAWCDWPTNEADLTARHTWLLATAPERLERLIVDPGYYDLQIAGWWVWGLCQWIGGGWCDPTPTGRVPRKRPHLTNYGRASGVLGFDTPAERLAYFHALAARLDKVKVCCGDWRRVLGGTLKRRPYPIGILLDPPYSAEERAPGIYRTDSLTVAQDVRRWAIEHGDNPDLRIALCGYAGEYDIPETWEAVEWKAPNGFLRQKGDRSNADLERIWFSPHCLKPETTPAPAPKPRKAKPAPAGTQLALFDE